MNNRDELIRLARQTQPGLFDGSVQPTKDAVFAAALLDILERLARLEQRENV